MRVVWRYFNRKMKKLIPLIVRIMPLLFGACLVFTIVMALIPSDALMQLNLWDKARHALAFAVLALTGSLAYASKTKVVYIGLILYGAGIEVMQSVFTSTRIGQTTDILADILGMVIGFVIYLAVRKAFRA